MFVWVTRRTRQPRIITSCENLTGYHGYGGYRDLSQYFIHACLARKKALPSWLVISKGWDNKNVSRTQTWKTLFLFPRPYFVIKRAQIMLESNNSNLNWPLYDIVISNILVWALIISFWWRYGYIFNICSKSFPNPQIFPHPWVAQVAQVAQVAPFFMSGRLFYLG